MSNTCAVCGDKFTPSEEVCGECEQEMFADDSRLRLERAVYGIAMQNLGASLALAGLAATLHATVFHEVVASFIHHGLDGVSARWDWCDRFALSSLRDRAGIAIPPEVTP